MRACRRSIAGSRCTEGPRGGGGGYGSGGAVDPETDREDREIDLAHSDRSKTPIEPYLADQWFVKMDELAQSAMDAVTSERVKIVPERYRQGLSRLAGREARLADWTAALVGASDSGLDTSNIVRRIAEDELAPAVNSSTQIGLIRSSSVFECTASEIAMFF